MQIRTNVLVDFETIYSLADAAVPVGQLARSVAGLLRKS